MPCKACCLSLRWSVEKESSRILRIPISASCKLSGESEETTDLHCDKRARRRCCIRSWKKFLAFIDNHHGKLYRKARVIKLTLCCRIGRPILRLCRHVWKKNHSRCQVWEGCCSFLSAIDLDRFVWDFRPRKNFIPSLMLRFDIWIH